MPLTLGLLALTLGAPPTGGLVLWLDAADTATIERIDAGEVTRWRDKSPAGNDATPKLERGPQLVDGAMAGKPVLRFAGSTALRTSKPLADGHGSLTVFSSSGSAPRRRRMTKGGNGCSRARPGTTADNSSPA